ncbi:uncharacterized protein PV09_01519 [Verruconis gallopava]|uniref:beta-glucosidase n=1 Tax=Verruconis gallopava TaxID=253628 RepID=A0A0D2ALD2_9PEZI|nr:uncharacterized protein PV09_01519 [Verruconis gallopava]KIW07563.1 hypothetical protein PV09_01519 [Verruconis gallopava]
MDILPNAEPRETRDDINQLARRLSLREQVLLLSGSDFWRTAEIPHHGIPSIKMTDGPSGARGEYFDNGTPAALFTCGISLAATWNTELIQNIGVHLGKETRARGANVLLAPTVNIHRSPLGGRNFESFSEDPFLTGKIAAAYIRGVQSEGVAATIKHFVANEQETHRMTINSVVDERTLREIYLKPFEIAIRESRPWALMSSYNLINGIHADVNEFTLKTILRGEWGFDGAVISDWTALTEATGVESVRAGCDIEMPGPAKWRGERLIQAVQSGHVSLEDVQNAVKRVLRLIQRTKGLENFHYPGELPDDNKALSRAIKKAAVEGIVLLKNDENILPIANARKIAVIGPNAERCVAGGGGSAKVNPYYLTSPLDGIIAATDAQVLHAKGCDTAKWLPLASGYCRASSGKTGVVIEYYKGDEFQNDPVSVQYKASTDLYLWDSAPKQVLPDYSFRVRTSLLPKTTGTHTLSFSSVGPGRLLLNGELFIDNWEWTEEGEAMFGNSMEVRRSIYLKADVPVELLVESTSASRPRSKIDTVGTHGYGGCRIGYQEEQKTDLVAEAVKLASEADIAILVVGLDNEWESEGYDRKDMELPRDGSQDRLIEAVLSSNPRTVVVNQSGSPVAMPWADKVPAIVQAWYQGQEAGNALADVLFGKCNPSGKLPTTFPKRLEDNPSYGNWPGQNLSVVYEEGIFVGYRHYEQHNKAPLFPFGHGLSYTKFLYSKPQLSSTVLIQECPITVTVPITNVGKLAGHEVVQAYIRARQSAVPRPKKELRAFAKVLVQPGQTHVVDLKVDKYSVGYYNVNLGSWVAEQGDFEILIGASSSDIRCSATFQVQNSFTWLF